MREVGIRALKQNASAIVASAAAGETVVITDRGRPVAQLAPLPKRGGLARLQAAGLVRPPRRAIADVPPPMAVAGSLSALLAADRDDERYQPVWYLDTSATVKLVVDEDGSSAMRRWALANGDRLVASDLVWTELVRVARRLDQDAGAGGAIVRQAQAVLDGVSMVPVPHEAFHAAARLDPSALRTLDALHLAVALDLGDDLEGLVTYDERLAEAARRHAVEVVSPRR